MEKEEDKTNNLEEEEQKLEDLQNEYEDALKFDDYNKDMIEFFQEEFTDILKEEEIYEQEEIQFEDAINLLENELKMDNQMENEQHLEINQTNQQLQQDMKDEAFETSTAEENKKTKENATQDKQNAFNQIQEAKNNIAEISENEKKIEQAKKQKEEQKKKMQGFFGFLSAIVTLFCPISGLIVGIVGQLVANEKYEEALQRAGQEKLGQLKLRQNQEGLFNRFSQLQSISEERFQKAIKSAQSKSASILKGLNSKKDVEHKLNSLKSAMSTKLGSIIEKTHQKLSCVQTIQKFKDLHQEILPKIQELQTARTLNDLASVARNLSSQQKVVQTLRVNCKKNNQLRQTKAQ